MSGPREKKTIDRCDVSPADQREAKKRSYSRRLCVKVKVLLRWHRSCEDGRGRGTGTKKDVCVIVWAAFNDMAFPPNPVAAVR